MLGKGETFRLVKIKTTTLCTKLLEVASKEGLSSAEVKLNHE